MSKEACTGFSQPLQKVHKLWGAHFILSSSFSVSFRKPQEYPFFETKFRTRELSNAKVREKRRETDHLCWIYSSCYDMLMRRLCGGISDAAVRRAVVPHVPLLIVLTGRRCSAFSNAKQWHVYTYFCSHH